MSRFGLLYRNTNWLLIVVLIAMVPSQSLAVVEWNGFGSVIGSKSSSSIALDNGITKDFNLTHESRFGLNGTARLTDDIFVGLQVLAEGRQDNFNANFEWGFIRWEPMSGFSVRFGKSKNPIWLISDQVDVGFLYPWIRPPLEVYSINPITSIVSATVAYSRNLTDDLNLLVEVYTGTTVLDLDSGANRIEGSITDAIGVNLNLDLSNHGRFRLGYSQGDAMLTFRVPQSVTVSGIPTELPVLTDLDLGVTHFVSAGVEANFMNIMLYSEFARRVATNEILKEAQGWYVTLGYRIHKFLPHVTFAKQDEIVTTQVLLGGASESWSFGLNYFASDSVVLKADVLRTEATAGPANFASLPDGEVYVGSFGVDFIF